MKELKKGLNNRNNARYSEIEINVITRAIKAYPSSTDEIIAKKVAVALEELGIYRLVPALTNKVWRVRTNYSQAVVKKLPKKELLRKVPVGARQKTSYISNIQLKDFLLGYFVAMLCFWVLMTIINLNL